MDGGGFSHEDIRRQTDKILASSVFASSARMQRFLRFAVERSLDGRGPELKEYLIGVEIFDRPESYDPRVDPIVRVEARRLRAKLRSYYETAGHADRLVVELPTGTYAPRFHLREDVPNAQPGHASPSMAVLPFVNLSPAPESDYFSDGLAEELIAALTKVPGLRVVAWSSASQLKGRQQDYVGAGRQLSVGSVLVGSVRQAGGRLRVIAQLVDTCSGQYLWSETYDRQIQDIFAIQEEIARAIVASLRVRLASAPAAHARRGSRNPEAYDLYLRGRFYWNKRTPESLKRAAQLFEQALALDPEFALAHAGRADAYSLHADHGVALPAEVMPVAKAAAARALELDPSLAEPHASLGLIRSLYEWQWAEAEADYLRALELNPGYVTAHHWYSCDFLALRGRFDEAMVEAEVGVRLDPLSHVINDSVAYLLMLSRRFDDGLRKHRENLELNPYFYKSYTGMGRIYIQMGRYAEARQMLERGRELAGDVPNILAALGQAYALEGRRAEAAALLERLTEMARGQYVSSISFAILHLGLGEPERALDWLEFACQRRELTLAAIGVHPAYDPLRGERRFRTLLETVGLTGVKTAG